MDTSAQLAAELRRVNVEAVAKLAGVSTKTVYRLRHQQVSTSVATADRLFAAVRALDAAATEPGKPAGDSSATNAGDASDEVGRAAA